MGRDVLGEPGVTPEIGVNKTPEVSKMPEVTNFEALLEGALADKTLSKEEQADIITVLTEAKEAQKEALKASLEARKEVIIEAIARRILIENDSIDTDDLMGNKYGTTTQGYEGDKMIAEKWGFANADIIVRPQERALFEKLGVKAEDVVGFMNEKSQDEAYIDEIKEARNGVANALRLLREGKTIEQGNLVRLNRAFEKDASIKEEFISAILEGYTGKEGVFEIPSEHMYVREIQFNESGFGNISNDDVIQFYTNSKILGMKADDLVAELNNRKGEVKAEVKPVVIDSVEGASDSVNVILARLKENSLSILETNALIKSMKENPELKDKIIDSVVNALKVRYQGVKGSFEEDTTMGTPSIEFNPEGWNKMDKILMYFSGPAQIAIFGKDFVARLNEGRGEEPKAEDKSAETVDENAYTFETVRMGYIKDITKDIFDELDIKPGFSFEEAVPLNIVRYTNGKKHFDLFFKDGILDYLSPQLKEELQIKNREDFVRILNSRLESYLEKQAAEAKNLAEAEKAKTVVSQSEKYSVVEGEYTVKHGDNLATIVENIHGEGLSWAETQVAYREVAKKSGIDVNSKLATGQKLKMLTGEELTKVVTDYRTEKQTRETAKRAEARAELGKNNTR